ncbi:hypothetical protein WMY93_022926 [Mugilogobius chulae]|uniref:diphosphoinositol-pentakisphosphate 1-kinase n=1 Tax=Mugilogobius chulae TaxID=88201 RepID=A0AAW0NDD2_9GOBI
MWRACIIWAPTQKNITRRLCRRAFSPTSEQATYSRGVMSPGRHVRTRLYFTSESHVHSLLNMFRYGGLLNEEQDVQWKQAMEYLGAVPELNYMTQIVIMLYEDNNKDPASEERFHVELHFSPGVRGCESESAPQGTGFRPASSENKDKRPDQGSLEDLSQDQPDQALPFSEPISIQRRSPMVRNRKTGSMEVLSESAQTKPGPLRIFSSGSRQSPEFKANPGLGEDFFSSSVSFPPLPHSSSCLFLSPLLLLSPPSVLHLCFICFISSLSPLLLLSPERWDTEHVKGHRVTGRSVFVILLFITSHLHLLLSAPHFSHNSSLLTPPSSLLTPPTVTCLLCTERLHRPTEELHTLN